MKKPLAIEHIKYTFVIVQQSDIGIKGVLKELEVKPQFL